MKKLYSEENISKKPAIELLESLGYVYLPTEDCLVQRGSSYQVLLKGILRSQLRKLNRFEFGGVLQEFSAANIERAIEDIDIPLTEGLIRASESIYDCLMLGRSYQELVGGGKVLSFDLKYIDWDNIGNNLFHVTQEYVVTSSDGEHMATPDIVLFINGIPFAVIECKNPEVEIGQGIEQMLRNQQEKYIPQLFKFVQITMVTNKNEVRYGTTGTHKKYWGEWKEEDVDFINEHLERLIQGRVATKQDKDIISLFSKTRLIELTKHFVLFDANIKKICRYQQYYAVKRVIETINTYNPQGNRESGVIWHTQGSGKSLMMVMLAKYILMEMSYQNPRIILVSDRKELDKQIATTFTHTRCKPARATTGKNLVDLIRDGKADIITTVINKFNKTESSGVKIFDKDIFVLVDESHRSNYGELATKMRVVFPNACYIGFTGTPLMKKERNTLNKFGKLIHTYTIKEGVADKAIVPLIYEGRFVEQTVDEKNIDLWFEQTTKRLNEKQKIDLKQKWSMMKHLASTSARIKRIALDINEDFIQGYQGTGFKGILATNWKRDAVAYLECFEQFGDLKCEVCISSPDMREGVEDIEDGSNDMVINYWNKMMKRYRDEDEYEESIKARYVDGEIDILIVCSKFLTGFDAPICQVIYIDKELKEHGLLQAIARTNRIYDGKDYGMIVDYRGLIKELDEAMNMYGGAGLENFFNKDLEGTIIDVTAVIGMLRQSYSRLEDFFSSINNKQDYEELEVYLEDVKLRDEFYDLLCDFGKHLSIILNSEKVYDAIDAEERIRYQEAFKFYSKLRRFVKIRYDDNIDNKEYEKQMQNLLDTHLSVVELKRITEPVDILNKEDMEKELKELGSSASRADAIRWKLTKSIQVKYDENPAHYDRFSKRIKDALKEYKEARITDTGYLNKMNSILKDYRDGVSEIQYPEVLRNNYDAQAFYGAIGSMIKEELENPYNACMIAEKSTYQVGPEQTEEELIAELAIKITEIINKHYRVDWIGSKTILGKMEQDIDDLFYDYEQKRSLKLSFETIDKIIESVKITASRRFKK